MRFFATLAAAAALRLRADVQSFPTANQLINMCDKNGNDLLSGTEIGQCLQAHNVTLTESQQQFVATALLNNAKIYRANFTTAIEDAFGFNATQANATFNAADTDGYAAALSVNEIKAYIKKEKFNETVVEEIQAALAPQAVIGRRGLKRALKEINAYFANGGKQCWAQAPEGSSDAVVAQYEQKCENSSVKNNKSACKALGTSCAWAN